MDRPHFSTGLFGTVPFETANSFQLGLLLKYVPIGTQLVETEGTFPNGSG